MGNAPVNTTLELFEWERKCYPPDHAIGLRVLDHAWNVVADDHGPVVQFQTDKPGLYWAYAYGLAPNGTIVDDRLEMFRVGWFNVERVPCDGLPPSPCAPYEVYMPQHARYFGGDVWPQGETDYQPGSIEIRDVAGTLVERNTSRSFYGIYYFGITQQEIEDNGWVTGGNWTIQYTPQVPTTTGFQIGTDIRMPAIWHEGIPMPPSENGCAWCVLPELDSVEQRHRELEALRASQEDCGPADGYDLEVKRIRNLKGHPNTEIFEIDDWESLCIPFEDDIAMRVYDDEINLLAQSADPWIVARTDLPGIYWISASIARNGTLMDEHLLMHVREQRLDTTLPCDGLPADPCQMYEGHVPRHVERVTIRLSLDAEPFGGEPGIVTVYDADGIVVERRNELDLNGNYLLVYTAEAIESNAWAIGGNWSVHYQPLVPTTTALHYSWRIAMPSAYHDGMPRPPNSGPCACG